MRKIIAKTEHGKEYLYSRKSAMFAAGSSAQKIANGLNRIAWNVKNGEFWKVYEECAGDAFYIDKKIYITNGLLKVKSI